MRIKNIISACFLCLTILGGYSAINPISTQAKSPVKAKQKVKYKRHGPPPHAPAHGYRYKHQHGVELEYDSGLGVYVAVGMPGVYFHNGLYMKLSEGQWTVTAHFNGSWRVPTNGEVPYKLKKAKGKKPSKKGKTHGKKKNKKK
jgi:hypothetical protein